jgi:hypothetical protein
MTKTSKRTRALRDDELVRFEKFHAAEQGKRAQVRHIHSIKWRMLPEEISNTVAYGSGIHICLGCAIISKPARVE